MQTKLNNDLTGHSTNSNGSYWKFPDGTLICCKTKRFDTTCNTKWGVIYETPALEMGAWAYPFITTPYAFGSVKGSGGLLENVTPNNTVIGNVYVSRPLSNSTLTIYITVIGIGMWK